MRRCDALTVYEGRQWVLETTRCRDLWWTNMFSFTHFNEILVEPKNFPKHGTLSREVNAYLHAVWDVYNQLAAEKREREYAEILEENERRWALAKRPTESWSASMIASFLLCVIVFSVVLGFKLPLASSGPRIEL
jgi:polyferredoxin